MVRLGAVTYLNARPLVYGLESHVQFELRYDIPSECARLLHAHETDLGLIPSIEYLRGPVPYQIVPGPAVTSRGPVSSVAIYTRREPKDIRTIAMDTSSRTSVALATVMLRRKFDVTPEPAPMAPDLDTMLEHADAALIIGDTALFLDHEAAGVSKIDLGEEWTAMTGLPFVYACWTGWPGAVAPDNVTALQRARDAGVAQSDAVAAAYYPEDTQRQAVARRYFCDNIQYFLGADEIEGLKTFFRYASELDLVSFDGTLQFSMSIQTLADKVRAGERVSAGEALELYHHAPLTLLGELADGIRARKHPSGIVTYIIDRNVNYTNVCVARCNFCAFYRPVGSGEGYVLGFEEIFKKIDETIALGGVQLLLQGGHNPDLPIDWYEDLFRAIKQRYPSFKLHALSPPEVVHLTRMSRLGVTEVIDRLMAAGLDSIPGGGAEILVDRVRKLLNCYGKATADEWLDVMRQAHLKGLRTTATMMYGHVETVEERIEHMVRLREVQDETGGFTAFITWSYQPEHTELGGGEATGLEYFRMLALARIVLDNFPSLQASWVTQGGKVGQLSLAYGSNDMGSVMIEENVVRAAGASYCMDEVEIVRNIENAGFVAKRRNMHYDILGDPFFREQDVPRQLSLATARAEGDTSRPEELANYAARSASEKKLRSAH